MSRVLDDWSLADSLTAGETARVLLVCTNRVRQLRLAGALAGVPTPYGYLYSRQAVERLAAARAAGQGSWWKTRAARQRADAANATATTDTATP